MKRKNIMTALLFLGLMVLTFYIVFRGNSIADMKQAVKTLKGWYLLGAVVCSFFFVSAEGIIIWYLLGAIGVKRPVLSCVKYSFIGFFFSGITPSATGGQPAQLYCMSKDKIKASDSTVVLMAVAVIYKLVLVLIGVSILVFWHSGLVTYLGKYQYLYYFGLFLNVVVTGILIFIMVSPVCFQKIVRFGERILVKLRILKPSENRLDAIQKMAEDYHEAVLFFLKNKKHILAVCVMTFVQRISVFLITCLIYKGWGLHNSSMLTIGLLQGSVYVAVDMLPLPGSQGISELMYQSVFSTIFTGTYMTASLCITRGVSFYLVLLASAVVVGSGYLSSLYKTRTSLHIEESG